MGLEHQGSQVRGAVRNAAPFSLKDAGSMSIVTQGASGAGGLADASSMGKVIAATSLPPTQLVVTQQKQPGNVVGLPSLPTGQSVTCHSSVHF